MLLPGNIQAVTETPIYARTDGYVKKRLADIGDRVTEGQLLAELDSPEIDQQLRQAKAVVLQSRSALAQAHAAVQQAKANAALAESTVKRWDALVQQGILSKQEGDERRAAALAHKADVTATEANVQAAENNISAAEANVQRLTEIQGFQKVRAPYAGLITVRNVVLGTLVSAGSNSSVRELYRLTVLNPLKIMVSVPQSDAPYVHVGQICQFNVQEFGGRVFTARVERTAIALDASSRSLLTEMHFANPKGELLPGAYAQVRFQIHRDHPPLLVPGDAVLTGKAGPQLVVLRNGATAHYQSVQLGRDYGAQTEVLSGVNRGDLVVLSPSDEISEGVHVKILAQ
jgi:RND family efflux transporter MFP subunit